MRLIDKDKLWTRLQQYEDFECPATTSAFDTIADFRILLNIAPVVDAVPVVRCGECCKPIEDCPFKDNVMLKTDFCSYGERREDHEAD